VYDVAIVGAGPAGSTLARLVGDKYKVLLVDKRVITRSTERRESRKCCGGLLAPDAQKMLSEMGLGLPKSVLVEPQLFVVRAIDLPNGLERFYQRFYINMDRQRFDQWLLSLVPSSADLRLGLQFKACESGEDGFTLTLCRENQIYTERARILVGADGAYSRVRAAMNPRPPFPRTYIAIQEWVESCSPLPYFSALFDPEITDYYGWTIPKEDCLVIGAALPVGKDAIRKFELLKEKLRGHGFVFGKTLQTERGLILRPTRSEQVCLGTKGIALVGESAGWISPSSAEGLSYAFKTAMALAQALRDGFDGFEGRYRQLTGGLRRKVLLKNAKSYFIFHPLLRKIIMKLGIQSLEIYKPEQSANR